MDDSQIDAALLALDERARRAAGRLREATDATSSHHDQLGPAAFRPQTNGAEPMPDAQDHAPTEEIRLAGRDPSAPRPRILVAAAAVVLVLMAASVAYVVARDGDERTTVADGPGPQQYLVPGWLPDGWEPEYAAESRPPQGARDAGDTGTYEDDMVVYGDTGLSDPWEGPILAVTRYGDLAMYVEDVDSAIEELANQDGSEQVVINGEPAVVQESGADQITVFLPVADSGSLLMIRGYAVDRPGVLLAAEHATNGPAIDADGLPSGYEPIARGPAAASSPPGDQYGSPDAVVLQYGVGAGAQDEPGVAVGQIPVNDPSAASLIRLLGRWEVPADGTGVVVDETEARGRPAYRLQQTGTEAETGSQIEILQWYEPELGLVVSLAGFNTDEGELEQIAESLRVAEPAELEDLFERYPTAPDNDEDLESTGSDEMTAEDTIPGDDMTSGAVEVASGEEIGSRWRATLETSGTTWDNSELHLGFTWGVQGVETQLPLDAALGRSPSLDSFGAHTHAAVYGFLPAEAGAVQLELGDGEQFEATIYRPTITVSGDPGIPDEEGLTMETELTLFIGFVPVTGTNVQVTVYDTHGSVMTDYPQDTPITE